MNRLSSFQTNNSSKLFRLAKELNETKFFEIFLNEYQYKIVNHILNQNNLQLWKSFLDGSVVLNVVKSDSNENDENDENHNNDDDTIEEGHRPVKFLALHIRYLLWEKAIDFYYNAKSLDQLSTAINEVSDDYELIDKLEDLPDTEGELKEDVNNTTPPPPAVIREEEDDYDDDDDDDDDDSKKNTLPDDSKLEDSKLNYNDDGQIILEIPLSTFIPNNIPLPSAPTSSNDNTLFNSSSDTPIPASSQQTEQLIKEFNKVYHNFEYDRETLIKRRKLEKSDLQLEGTDNKLGSNTNNEETSDNMGIHFGSASHSLKHLLGKIQKQRDDIPINDYELRTLFMDVRKNRGKWANDSRVGQEELFEACEKVVLDLRSYTEHSTPFLNKVSKREAPNYGLIIKKPMDLNTILKKLKNLAYNSKKEFVDDVMLIWSNCLTYNADPKHFLRAHALAMQKRALKLIPSIPNITIRNRADVEKEEAEFENNENKESTPSASGKASKKGRKRTRENQIKTEDTGSIAQSPEIASQVGTPKASETPIPMTGDEGAGTVGPTGTAGVGEEEEEDLEGDDVRGGENDLENEAEVDPELQAWRSLTAKSRAHYCAARAELFDDNMKLRSDAPAIIRESNEMNNFNHYLDNKQVVSKSSNLLENDEPYLLEYDITGGLPGVQYKGVDDQEEEQREQKLVDVFLQQSGGDPNKIKSNFILPTESGLNKIYFENITEIQEIRKICFKISLIRQMQTQQFVHHTQMKQPEVEYIREVDIDPVSKLPNHDPHSAKIQFSVLRRNIAKIAMQTGFETAQPFAVNTLTQIAENYMGNLIKSIKLHSETASSNRLNEREILLLSLVENGVDKPDDLYTFVQERLVKQTDKLKDLRVKLSNFLKELLRPGLENFNERSFEDNSEQFMTGDFSNDLGDDFFGFKELGLDKEFKLLSSSIPIYLLHSRLNSSYNSTGVANKSNKYEDFKEWDIKKLSEADIKDQIGLLQPFYTKLLEKSKAHYVKIQRKKGERTDLPPADQLMLIEDEELPQKQRNIRPRLPPTGKISSVKKRIVANAFFLPEPSEQESNTETNSNDQTNPIGNDSYLVKPESSSKPVSPQKLSVKA
ncbi:hypothetical protein HYPBUDRAFT_109370 [Hyphopichia burtonii NRRL Y-1933]|uniref:SAGA complex subunit Spt7 n=1 Tax=Hyphopichia burtonii NRRL Y-1933 TaxID=984485 RepID=A0A1E4RI77_9ASCO|nr:hypothetical protein HYPBUDRAFT_109370 [Hyphopichia burtonii NRRL Y-1933]ODV66940.1 hypothetical protein HYPBUDRAFT_109370 [Hyphopichia burtonii NRRL Y-1933]